MIFKNYLLFILRKDLLIKFNFGNIFSNLYIKQLFIISPYYIYKFKLKFSLISLYKILLLLFNQRIFLFKIKFKNIFKTKFVLLNFILTVEKNMFYKLLDYFFIFLKLNYDYFIKKKTFVLLYNNKLL
jgi:hypothetical protein